MIHEPLESVLTFLTFFFNLGKIMEHLGGGNGGKFGNKFWKKYVKYHINFEEKIGVSAQQKLGRERVPLVPLDFYP